MDSSEDAINPQMPPRPSRVADFFRRYEWMFSLLGAGIVFTTFLVKDGLQSRFEREAASLSAAESMFSLRSETAATNARLSMIEREAKIRAGEIEMPSGFTPDISRCEDMRERLDLLKARAGVLRLLVQKIPGASLPTWLEPDSGEFQEVANKISGVELMLSPRALAGLPPELVHAFPSGPEEASAEMSAAADKISALEQAVEHQEEHARAIIHDRQSTASDRARAAQMLNTLLFCLGWALGLFSKWPSKHG